MADRHIIQFFDAASEAFTIDPVPPAFLLQIHVKLGQVVQGMVR
jgi:hypothetical protein